MDDSATMINMKAMEKELSDSIMQRRIESFCEDWQPKDPQHIGRFVADLHMLVKSIYVEAQEPLLSQYTKMISLIPFGFGGVK